MTDVKQENTNRIQLYSMATPNGQKASIALEEMGLPYDSHTIDIRNGDQFTDDFIAINPNSKIPAIVDPDGPGGQPISIMESGSILIYLAEKSGMYLSSDARLRNETLQWLFFQVGGVGPMFGQFGHFHRFAGEACQHPYPVERYRKETRRLLGVLEKRLQGRSFLVGEAYSIADMATVPWVKCLDVIYQAKDLVGLDDFSHVNNWVDRVLERPATAKGMTVCSVSR